MARKKKSNPSNTSSEQKSAAEMRDWYAKNKNRLENFEKAQSAAKQLMDISQNKRYRTISRSTKNSLRGWLQAPSSNEKNLRNLSIYLYYRSQIYMNLINFYANMLDLNSRSVIPPYDLVNTPTPDEVLQSYNETLQLTNKMPIQYEFLKGALRAWREDVFYGCAYLEDDGQFFILPLDPDYCKIVGIRGDSTYIFAFNMSYFKKYSELLELWGEPWVQMDKEYGNDTKKQWQIVPDEYSVCLKFRAEEPYLCIPPLSGLFNSLLSLISMEDIQDVADEQQIYKLLVATLPTLSGSKEPDDWAVDPSTAIDYFNRMNDELPDYIAATISPIPIEQISFDSDQSDDVLKIQKATESVLNTGGAAHILNTSKLSGTTAWNGAIRAASEFAISTLLPQIEKCVNRLISFKLKNPSYVKFIEISVYTKQEYKESILKQDQYGLSSKLLVNNLNGFTEMDTLALNYLENTCLNLNELLVPVQSSHTQSTSENESGGQTKSITELTDEGEASIDKRDRSNG